MDITFLLNSFTFQCMIVAMGIFMTVPMVIQANHTLQTQSTIQQKFIWVLLSLFVWISTIAGIWHIKNILYSVPIVTKVTPPTGYEFNPISPSISLQFSAPVKYEKLTVHTYPETDVFLRPSGFFANLFQFGTKLILVPRTTLPPGQQYMVYVSNIEGPLTNGYGGERLLKLTNPDIHVSESSVTHDDVDVSTTEKIIIKLNRPMVSGKEWSVQMQPSHDMRVIATDPQTIEVVPRTPLHQGTKYTMKIMQTPILLILSSQEEMTRLEERVFYTIDFTTVKPAYISSIDTQGNNVNPASPFHIVFDQPMDPASVAENVTITPAIPMEFIWSENNTSLTLQHQALPKDTSYTLALRAGIRTASGGTLESDAKFSFKTAGALSINTVSPTNGDTDIPPSIPIRVTFNQNIPQSISGYFDLKPKTAGAITVEKNELVFTPQKQLSPDTLYTITLAANAPSLYGLPLAETAAYSFTTKPKEVVLEVPHFHQQSNFTCNIAAARMLLAYRGVQTTEAALINTIGLGGKRGSGNPSLGYIDDYGTYWQAILRGITAHKSARIIDSGKLSDLLYEIDKGNPVMTWGQNGWSDPHDISWKATDGTQVKAINGMHSSVVRGYQGTAENPTLIYINDPWRGQYAISPEEFMRRWKYLSMALVID